MWKCFVVRFVVPNIWPIQEGINLTQKEVTTFKEVGFSFDCLCSWNNVRSLFGSQSSNSSNSHVLIMSCHNLVRLFNANYWLTTHGGKKVKWTFVFKLTQHGRLRFYFSSALFSLLLMSPPLGYGRIYNIISYDQGYDVTIGNFPKCSCVYFVTMLASSLGSHGVYV